MNARKNYEAWCARTDLNDTEQAELLAMADDDLAITKAFGANLSFGTAGLRGIMGMGSNCLNRFTIAWATAGIAEWLLETGKAGQPVVVSTDSRLNHRLFAHTTALVLAQYGFPVLLWHEPTATPILSWSVRHFQAAAGIMITASHNPSEYNGYKVYWEDGAQITAPKDSLIINEVNSITDFGTLKTMDKDEAIKAGLYNVVADEVDDAYIAELKKQVINPDVVKEMGDKLVAVYTPLHGTGNIPARRVLKEIGLNKVYVVPEQELPDGDFPTVGYPNPEDPKAFELALKLADEVNADVVLATDPDADRLGVYAKDSATGKYMSFTGNMSGMLIAEYILSEKKAKGILPKNGALIKTIVTTNLADVVAKEYNVKLIEVLTGFKYIGEQIKLFEQNHSYEYVFGFEESYGCLVGTHARDKDAIVAVMMLCEAAAYYKKHGLTLWDQMLRIYEKYGYFKETLVSITKKGKEGLAEIQGMLDKLRSNPPKEIGGYKVLATRDYNNNTVTKADGTVTETGLPKSNVLYFDLEDNAWCCARPSGTEPKIKFYMGVKGNSFDDADAKLEKLKNDMMAIVE